MVGYSFGGGTLCPLCMDLLDVELSSDFRDRMDFVDAHSSTEEMVSIDPSEFVSCFEGSWLIERRGWFIGVLSLAIEIELDTELMELEACPEVLELEACPDVLELEAWPELPVVVPADASLDASLF